MKILLLGASGLLGHNVLQALLTTGHQVVALVRRRNSVTIDHPHCLFIERPALDNAALLAAAEGCDAIVNCAGVTDMGLLRLTDYTDINCHLCKRIVNAMEHHGIRRLVHVSTANTIGNGSAGHPSGEDAGFDKPFSKSLYAISKKQGEEVLTHACHEHPDWHIVIVNPGFMLGPMDTKPSSGKMLLTGYRPRLMLAPRGGKAFIDVRDAAAAVVAALERGEHGQRYLLTNNQALLTIKELYELQARVMGHRQHVVTLPDWLLLAAGALGDLMRLLGIHTALSSVNVRQLMTCEYYDNRRAAEALGLTESPIGQAIADFHAWRKEHKTNTQNKMI